MSDNSVAAWARPTRREVRLDFAFSTTEERVPEGILLSATWEPLTVRFSDMLIQTGFAPSRRAVQRLLKQPIFWLDDLEDPFPPTVELFSDRLFYGLPGIRALYKPHSITDRLKRVDAVSDSLTVKPGYALCIGKTTNEAICHRILFQARGA